MAVKCGHDTCPDTNCSWKHLFNGGKRAVCNRRKNCFETHCSSLKAYGPSGFALYDICLGHCHREPNDPKFPGKYPTVEQYLCDNFDPVSLVDYFGINPCGVPPGETQVGKTQAAENNNATAIWFVVAALAIAGSYLAYKLLKK